MVRFKSLKAKDNVWNWALHRTREHFRQTGKTLKFSALCAELTQLKQQPATVWLREMDSQSLQQTLRDLENASQHVFRRARNGDKKSASALGISQSGSPLAARAT